MKGDEREGQGNKMNRNESEETEETLATADHPLQNHLNQTESH